MIVRRGLPDCHALIRMDPPSATLATATAGALGSVSPRTSGKGCGVGPGLGGTTNNEGLGLLDGGEYGRSRKPKMQPASNGPQRATRATERKAMADPELETRERGIA